MNGSFANYPPENTEAALEEYKCWAVDYAYSHGIAFLAPSRVKETEGALPQGLTLTHAPFTLYPSPFPRALFNSAYDLGPAFATLYHRVANDERLMAQIMEEVSEHDDFTARLYAIYKEHYLRGGEGPLQKITLGLHRSDYMLHYDPESKDMQLKQVEYNTISVSFSGLTHHVVNMHRFLAERSSYFNTKEQEVPTIKPENLPENKCGFSLAAGLASAWKLYGSPKAYVLFVVQPAERNLYDQRFTEYTLFNNFGGIPALRRTLAEVAAQGRLDPATNKLFIETSAFGSVEISVVYFRAGYAPSDYGDDPSSPEWRGRALIEKSLAVKCPNIAHHLAGAKKVQQVLTMPGMLERYIDDKDLCAALRRVFTNLYPMGETPEGKRALQLVIKANGKDFVLKPQREGGGNNVYEGDIVPFIEQKLPERDRSAYVLMDLIKPPPLRNVLIKDSSRREAQVVSELGIYQVWLSNGPVVLKNYAGGHNFRTKVSTEHEGGVATGYAVLDSPVLF